MKNISISDKQLSGGVVSSVFPGWLQPDGGGKPIPIVLKRTARDIPVGGNFTHFDAALLANAPATHALDAQVLTLLQDDPNVRVPTLYAYDETENETVMRDFRADGFRLLQDLLVKGKLPPHSAEAIGQSLAALQLRMKESDFDAVKPVEDPTTQVRERLHELCILLYDGRLKLYRSTEEKLLEDDGLLYTDGHPKNIAARKDGNVMPFDFGRMIRGSFQYPPANFAAHIGLATIGGCMSPKAGTDYIQQVATAYNRQISVDETLFVIFFLAEWAHRGLAWRWIDKRMAKTASLPEIKLASHALFERMTKSPKSLTMKKLMRSIEQTAWQIQNGDFKKLVRAKPLEPR